MPALEMVMQKPTVGRVVHFYTNDQSKHGVGQSEGPYSATVAQVNGDGSVNLKVFPVGGAPYDAMSVTENADDHTYGQRWEWPPRE